MWQYFIKTSDATEKSGQSEPVLQANEEAECLFRDPLKRVQFQ